MRLLILFVFLTLATNASAEGSRSVASGLFGDPLMLVTLVMAAIIAGMGRALYIAYQRILSLHHEQIQQVTQRVQQAERTSNILQSATKTLDGATEALIANAKYFEVARQDGEATREALRVCVEELRRLRA